MIVAPEFILLRCSVRDPEVLEIHLAVVHRAILASHPLEERADAAPSHLFLVLPRLVVRHGFSTSRIECEISTDARPRLSIIIPEREELSKPAPTPTRRSQFEAPPRPSRAD